jgi:hypothetical protein
MAATVAAMLRIADRIIFVDPYFRPGRLANYRPLEGFLRAMVTARPLDVPAQIEVQTSWGEDRWGTREFFEEQCLRSLPRCVPEGLCVGLLRLRQKKGGERFHNRYILTDVGGLVFGIGLDDGPAEESDDVTVMPRVLYEKRWSQYVTDVATTFDIEDGAPIEIRSRR